VPGDVSDAITRLMQDYEETGDAVLRLLALEPRHPCLAEFLDYGRSEHRRWVSAAFAESVGALDAPARERAIDALVVVTDVYAWKLLRRDMRRSAAAATAAMRTLVRAVITECSRTPSAGEGR